MPLTSSATDVFGLGTLVLVILCCCTGVSCLALVLFFHFKVGKQQQPQQFVLRDFESPWIVRMVLAGFCVLWSLGELARLSWLREGNGVLHSVGLDTQANLCRFHVVWSVGVMEPGFLLTVLFLVQGSLQVASTPARNINSRVLILMPLFCSPVFILQLILALTGRGGSENGFGGTVPSYFTNTYETDTNSKLALCNYPLLSILLLGLFSLIFVFYFSLLGVRMLNQVINRKLQMRAYWLVMVVMVLFPLHVIFLGLSVRIHPSKAAHEVLIFLGFLALLLCAAGAMGVLVVLPVADAIAAYVFYRKRDQTLQSYSASHVDLFGRLLSAVVSDDENVLQNASRRSLLGAVSSSTGTEAGSSRRDVSLILDTVPKDLTLGPGGWLVDIPGSLTYQQSLALQENSLSIL